MIRISKSTVCFAVIFVLAAVMIINRVHDVAETLEKISTSTTGQADRADKICKNTTGMFPDWKALCSTPFLEVYDNMMIEGKHVNIVQIGAHIGWTRNDPLYAPMGEYLELLSDIEKKQVHWTYVEPSPPNYDCLLKNIAQYSYLCDMNSINAAIVSDSYNSTENMMFYQMDECIDVVTGHDSKSGKRLPSYLSQLSGFDFKGIGKHLHEFKKRGLNPHLYYHKINVKAVRYSDLMVDIMGNEGKVPYLLLMDTQGMDCQIILGISENSPYLPQYLMYEDSMCTAKELDAANKYLEHLGYSVSKLKKSQNTFAYRSIAQ